jgi:predicted RNase H-like HicB family nuclease
MPRYKFSIEFRVSVIIEPDGDGFHAYCPALKGLHVYGDTEGEAMRNAGNAASAYFESLIKHGDPIPVGVDTKKQVEEITTSTLTKRHIEELTVACAI